ncbi:hypothetical protein DsansV1_C09g0090291 [Dioscorea sansibarensis]
MICMGSSLQIKNLIAAEKGSVFHTHYAVTLDDWFSCIMDCCLCRFASAPARKKATESNRPGKVNMMGNQKPRTLDARFACIQELRMRGPQGRRQGHWPIRGRNKAQAVSWGTNLGTLPDKTVSHQ